MSTPSTCPSCATPVGQEDRLCWNCGASTVATPDPAELLGATRNRADLVDLVGGGPSPEPVSLLKPASLPPMGGLVSEPAVVLIELGTDEPGEGPAEVAGPAPGAGFCGSCGWSFAERPGAAFCGSCGAARSGAPEPAPLSALRPVPVPVVSRPAPVPVAGGATPTTWSPDPHELWRSIGPIDRSWSGRIRRGWELTKLSLELMRRQPGLVAVPFAVAAVIGVLFLLFALLAHGFGGVAEVIIWLPGLAAIASVSMIGQAVITRRVAVAVSGGSETNSQAFTAIRPRLWDVCKWGMLSATVGTLIRSLARGRGLIGIVMRIISVALAVIWSSMTFFVLPVILFEGLAVGPAITRSKQLVRVCWGEGVVGVGVLSALLNLLGLAGVLLAVLFLVAHVWVLAVIVLLATVVGINVLAAIASPVFTVVLYRYATTGEVAFGLSVTDLGAAFRRPKGASRVLR